MIQAYDDNKYQLLIEKYNQSNIDVIKGRQLVLVILQQLQPYYNVILSMDGMEAFERITGFCDYIQMHIYDDKISEIQDYITLCNEIGQIVGESEVSELFSEDEISTMREKYYSMEKNLEGKERVVCDYSYCIFASLYYMMTFFTIEINENEKAKNSIKDLIEYIFEDSLLDFNEEMFLLTKTSFFDDILNILLSAEQIEQIMKKMKQLSSKNPKFKDGEFPPKWGDKLSLDLVERYERENRIILPKDYKFFITTVAGSCSQPFYGLYSPLEQLPDYEVESTVCEKFLYTVTRPLVINDISEDEYDRIYETKEINVDTGFIPLCSEGCGMLSILIVNTDDAATYGTVWFYDLCNDCGIFPLIHPTTKCTMHFLDWLEYYVDRTLELDDDDFFSYGELAGQLGGD